MPTDNHRLWELPVTKQQHTALWRFADATRPFHGGEAGDYAILHHWSVADPDNFYRELWDHLGIIGERTAQCCIPDSDIRHVRFYPGATLNYAENLLSEPDDRLAIIACRENGERRTLTRLQLYDNVSCLVQALQRAGVEAGDRVAAIVTNDLEAITGLLAASAIGAIWSSCSPDFGPAAASDRLCQVAPKIILSITSYQYSGKTFDVTPVILEVAGSCTPEKIVLLSGENPESLAGLPCVTLEAFTAPFVPQPIPFKRLPYDAPLAILFSSGTTGKPKCIVHSAMGLLIQHKKELVMHCDLKAGEKLFYFTTCGWMMWNWQVTGLSVGATLVTFDGNPFFPGPERLLQLAQDEQVEVFGTSAKYIDSCQNAGLSPIRTHHLDKLRLVLSTGSPLAPTSFEYIYGQWKRDVHLASISGGTDICGCFLGGNPLLPVYPGELQCAFLGMDMDTLDGEGNPVTGMAGELVCRNAHLTMPLGFWGDESGERYRQAYFDRFPGIWTHGDFVEKRASGGYVIYGRSDTTLNPGGVRIGTAEIYRQLDAIAEVEDAVVVGQSWQGDQRIVLFVCLAEDVVLDESLITHIKQRIRQGATPRHVPARILAVSGIPRTRSGKVSETAVRDLIHGREISNRDALANPECLVEYEQARVSLQEV